ncbi:MAG: response regulator [Cyanobacteria bacterium J06631_9]
MSTETISTAKATVATKIMIVEDESIIALDIKTSLSRLGYEVSGVAASGESALMKIRDNRPQLVLMDIHLKGEMNGIQVSEIIQSEFQLPIIYLTANADGSTFKAAQRTDPHAYLLKPFDEKALGIAIEVALNQHRKVQAIKSSEHWYANAFQCLNEAVMATDSTGAVVFMNAISEDMTGISLRTAINQPIASVLRIQRKIQQLDRLSLRKKDSVDSILQTVLNSGVAVPFSSDTQLVSEPHAFVAIEGSATSIREASGRITGSLFVFRPEDWSAPSSTPSAAEEQVDVASMVTNAELKENPENPVSSEDIELIKTFAQAVSSGETVLLSTRNLVATSDSGLLTLSAKGEGIVVSVKSIKGKPTAVVAQGSAYWEVVRHMLVENSFFPISRRTNGTCYFQHRAIPEDCQLFHTSAMELWETWYGKSCPDSFNDDSYQMKLPRESIVVLRRGSWYRIQSLVLRENSLNIKTIAGEIFLSSDDLLIWGARA